MLGPSPPLRSESCTIFDPGLGKACIVPYIPSANPLDPELEENVAWESECRRKLHEEYRWCEHWMMGNYYSTHRVPGDVVESTIRNCVPGQEVQVFGITDWVTKSLCQYHFIVRLRGSNDGVLSPHQFILSEEVQAETGLLCGKHAALVRPQCHVSSLVQVRHRGHWNVQGWLMGALGSHACPGGLWNHRCFGDFSLREEIIRALRPLVMEVLFD